LLLLGNWDCFPVKMSELADLRAHIYYAVYFMKHGVGYFNKRSPIELTHAVHRELWYAQGVLDKMSAKKQIPTQEKPDFANLLWVNRNLTDSEKEEHDKRNIKPADVVKELIGLALVGYNFALKYDAYSKGYQTTLVVYNSEHKDFGYAISARSSDPYRAMTLLLFKHFDVLGESWKENFKMPGSGLEG
jgi:hypothetical protein